MIEITGLHDEQHKKLGALSKGYRQRVGLAQALIHDPEVLILDEPTSGLDPNQLAEIRSLIRSIGREKTVMMSTHIMQEVESICDRAIIIHKGRIVADDATKNLQNLATSRPVIRVEFGQPVDGAVLKRIRGVVEVSPAGKSKEGNRSRAKEESSTVWFLASDPASDIRGDVFQFAVDHKLTVLSLQKEEQKMEEVFQELTKN
jgi:ABC-2 type transport system ATP-binding protein